MTAHELERRVQPTYAHLYPFFMQHAPRQTLKWMPFFLGWSGGPFISGSQS